MPYSAVPENGISVETRPEDPEQKCAQKGKVIRGVARILKVGALLVFVVAPSEHEAH